MIIYPTKSQTSCSFNTKSYSMIMKPGRMIFKNQEDYDTVDVSGIDPGLKVYALYFFVDLLSISEG